MEQAPLDLGLEAPTVLQELQNLDVEEGEPVRFHCVITSKPRKLIGLLKLIFK